MSIWNFEKDFIKKSYHIDLLEILIWSEFLTLIILENLSTRSCTFYVINSMIWQTLLPCHFRDPTLEGPFNDQIVYRQEIILRRKWFSRRLITFARLKNCIIKIKEFQKKNLP